MTVNDVTHPHDLDADLDHADKVMAGVMDSYHLRKRYIHADGTVLTGYLTVSGIRETTVGASSCSWPRSSTSPGKPRSGQSATTG